MKTRPEKNPVCAKVRLKPFAILKKTLARDSRAYLETLVGPGLGRTVEEGGEHIDTHPDMRSSQRNKDAKALETTSRDPQIGLEPACHLKKSLGPSRSRSPQTSPRKKSPWKKVPKRLIRTFQIWRALYWVHCIGNLENSCEF